MSETTSIRVFSVDDHALLREGIAAVITNEPDMVLVAQASTGREAIQLYQKHRPDVTLDGSSAPGHERHRRDDRDPHRIARGAGSSC